MHPIEVALKRIKMPGPVLPERREPGVNLEEGLGLETVHSALGVHRGFHEARILENAQVLGDGWLRKAKPLLELADRLLRGEEEGQDGPAVGLREDCEGRLHCLICYLGYITVKAWTWVLGSGFLGSGCSSGCWVRVLGAGF